MNKTILMGRLTRDPETRYTQTGKMVINFTLAVNRRYEEGADFFYVTAWNKTGEFVSKYFKKGQQVLISGRLRNRTYDTKDGSKKTIVEIVAEEVFFADSKKDTENEKNTSEENFINYTFDPNFNIVDEDDELPF